jgi:biopolymer transport protein ExbB
MTIFDFAQFMRAGGPVNYVIAALYMCVLAVFSERIVYFFRTRYRKDRILKALETGGPSLESLLPRGRCQPLRMARCFFANAHEPGPVLQEILDREAELIRAEMEKRLGILSFIGTVAPLLGLLGTITGLMNAFNQISRRGSSVDIGFLSGGIWEAMITTATGLVTAICAVSCLKWFEHLSASRLGDMGRAVSLLAQRNRQDLLAGGRGAEAPDYADPRGSERSKVKESA